MQMKAERLFSENLVVRRSLIHKYSHFNSAPGATLFALNKTITMHTTKQIKTSLRALALHVDVALNRMAS